MTDLFDIPEVLSPRLAWMRKHNIETHHDPDNEEALWCAYQGPWVPYSPHEFADTEEEALLDLAAKLNIKDWRQ